MARKMTKRMAEAMIKRICKLYGVGPDEIKPTYNDIWYGPDQPIIGWEEGPFEWSISEKINELAPKGWYVEACNHWAIALYPI